MNNDNISQEKKKFQTWIETHSFKKVQIGLCSCTTWGNISITAKDM